FDVAFRSERMTPVCAFDVAPPLIMISEGNFVIGRRENDRARDQILCWRCWEFLLRRRAFGNRHVRCRSYELFELSVGDRGGVHPKSIDAHAMDWTGVI